MSAFIVVVHPADSPSYVLDAFNTRARAEAEERLVEDERTSVSVEWELIELDEALVKRPAPGCQKYVEECRCSTTECSHCGSEDIRHHHRAVNRGCPPDTVCVMITCDQCGETV